VAKSEREMKEMIKGLGKYVRMKNLEVNVEKTKIIERGRVKRMSGTGKGRKQNK
jgi:hypothetical protein